MSEIKPNIPTWIKSKGYLHLTPNIDVHRNWKSIYQKVTNPIFVKSYAFYPLIHSVIRERKYKKIDPKKFILKNNLRSHKLKDINSGNTKSAAKERPLHYATHFDSIIYSYYAYVLQEKYEEKLQLSSGLSECITAYRKLKIDPLLPDNTKGNGKSTIHFAKEIFDEILNRSHKEEVAVLAFDIKSFFSSLDHNRLREIWEFTINKKLPEDHLAVFNASTKFSYILLDDLRIKTTKVGRKSGFDEKKLAHIRKTSGHKCFFESSKDFRDNVKSGKLKIHKHPFYNKEEGKIMGIPQGLPISAILANMYLYNFDLEILNNLVDSSENCYYRRYSDDIIVICNVNQINKVKEFVESHMKSNFVEISKDKTEIFKFVNIPFNKFGHKRLTSFKINKDDSETECPLIYLGFEFRGYNTLIKSANIAKFYRRIISVIRRRAKRARRSLQKNPQQKNAIYLNQVKKIYSTIPKKKDNENENLPLKRSHKILVINDKREYYFKDSNFKPKKKSNYFSYLKRVSAIMEDESMKSQLRKSKHIVRASIKKYLNKN